MHIDNLYTWYPATYNKVGIISTDDIKNSLEDMLKNSKLIYTFFYNIYIYIQYADIYGIVAVANSNVVWPALNAYDREQYSLQTIHGQ